MTTRAKRREAGRISLKRGDGVADEALVVLQVERDKLRDWCVSYKARLNFVTIGLNAIQIALLKNDLPAANGFMRRLFASPLAEARKSAGDHDFALRIAIEALKTGVSTKISRDAIAQIEKLVPEAFAPADPGTAAAPVGGMDS